MANVEFLKSTQFKNNNNNKKQNKTISFSMLRFFFKVNDPLWENEKKMIH